LRPFREAPNFYLCEHCGGRRRFEKIHYEGEMEAVEEEPEYWSEPLI